MNDLKSKNFLILLVLFSPIFYNYFFRLIPRETRNLSLDNPDFINIGLGVLFFLFLLFIGNQIRFSLNLSSLSISIVLYFFSFFIFDNYFLFITRFFNIKFTFLFVNLAWILIFFINKKSNIYKVVAVFSFMYLFREFGFELLYNNFDLSPKTYTVPDETEVWLPVTKNIFANNYFYGLETITHNGYGLLIAYINSISSVIFLKSSSFIFFPFIKNVFYFLTLLFIYEIKGSDLTKLVFSIFLTIVTLNSHWFRYIFFNSMMLESGVSYFFGVIMYSIMDVSSKKEKYICSLLLGFLFFSKQFIAGLAILYLIYLYIKKELDIFALSLGLTSILIAFLNAISLKVDMTWRNYLSFFDSSWTDERSYNLENFQNIINQFLIDKPVSYLLFVLVILYSLNLKNNYSYFRDFSNLIFFNTFLVFMLYIFIWTDVEYGSSYRYLMNIFHLLIPIYIYSIDNFLGDNKKL